MTKYDRMKNKRWAGAVREDGTTPTDHAQLMVLCDIRDELQMLNGILNCPNFIRIPAVLDQIRRNTKRPTRRKTNDETR
jgi:hypothetical protein